MTKLREAAQAVMTAETLNQMATALDALRDALAEPDEVLAEREACAVLVAQLLGENLAGVHIAEEIRARGKK